MSEATAAGAAGMAASEEAAVVSGERTARATAYSRLLQEWAARKLFRFEHRVQAVSLHTCHRGGVPLCGCCHKYEYAPELTFLVYATDNSRRCEAGCGTDIDWEEVRLDMEGRLHLFSYHGHSSRPGAPLSPRFCLGSFYVREMQPAEMDPGNLEARIIETTTDAMLRLQGLIEQRDATIKRLEAESKRAGDEIAGLRTRLAELERQAAAAADGPAGDGAVAR